MLLTGESTGSGCYLGTCQQLNNFEQNMISSSEEQSTSDEDNQGMNLNQIERAVQEYKAKRCAKNKLTAKKLVDIANSDRGLVDLWKMYSKDTIGTNVIILNSEDKQDFYFMFVNTCVYHLVPKRL